jgi:hypothetical protein
MGEILGYYARIIIRPGPSTLRHALRKSLKDWPLVSTLNVYYKDYSLHPPASSFIWVKYWVTIQGILGNYTRNLRYN